MKKEFIILAILVSIVGFSCKNDPKSADPEIVAPEEKDIMEEDENSPEIICYQFASGKDTVLMQMERINEDVTGSLRYNYFEKDENQGIFEGTMAGDTLYADYTFKSEGKTSVREIMFIQKENRLIEVFGEVEEIDGQMKFKENTKFSLNDSMPLEKVICE